MKQHFLRRRKELKNEPIPFFTYSYRIIIKLENLIWDDIVRLPLPDVLRLQPISSKNAWQEFLFLFWCFCVEIPRLADTVFEIPKLFWTFMLRNIYWIVYVSSPPPPFVNRRGEHKLGHHTLAIMFTCAVSYAGLGKKSSCFKGLYLLK